jgi:regulator of protease activity HflC (stomatin/prohibitin superfamily)
MQYQQAGSIDGVAHSRCVQTRISNSADAPSAFERSGTSDITLVAVPEDPCTCCCFIPYDAIPSGYYVMGQEWGRRMPSEIEAGVRCCKFFSFRVSHIVNKATITYSAPSRQVPTADNVMIDINLSLTFSVHKFEGAESFVYSLGCARFDEFLSDEVEEGICGLVYSVTHDRVNDLREEFAQNMLLNLARKFLPFGVQVKNVKVTDVALPNKLAKQLEETTTFKTKISETAKKHENAIRVLQDEAAQRLEAIVRTNSRRKQDLLAQCARYEIEHKEIIDEVVGTTRVAEIETQSKMDVLIAQAKGNLEIAQAEGEKEAEEVVRKAQIDSDKRRVAVDQQKQVIILESEGNLVATENNAKAKVTQGEAEDKAAPQLEIKRKFELEWMRLEVLNELAKNGRRFVSGDTGKALLKEMVPIANSFSEKAGKKAYF